MHRNIFLPLKLYLDKTPYPTYHMTLCAQTAQQLSLLQVTCTQTAHTQKKTKNWKGSNCYVMGAFKLYPECIFNTISSKASDCTEAQCELSRSGPSPLTCLEQRGRELLGREALSEQPLDDPGVQLWGRRAHQGHVRDQG